MERNRELIGGHSTQVLERRPQLLQEVRLFVDSVTTAQDSVQRCCGALFAGAISRSSWVGKEDHVNETTWDLHYAAVDVGNFLSDSSFRFVRQRILCDRGV
jgi:hypothetical protein